jgi:hypothetical protein
MEAKMMGLLASILKIDFNYKLASKIRVWTKQGQSFSPFKCLVTVQNEDGLTVFWKALKQSESFAEITLDLIRLRHRLKRNLAITRVNGNDKEAVKVVYVDNCCNVCNQLQHCFPGALVKLDAFHWLKRWNKILHDPKSGHGGVFRALMSRALFSCGPDEFANAKERLLKKGKTTPSTKEILKEANSVIPEPFLLRGNMEAVLEYCLAKDAKAERLIVMRREDDESPCPSRFFTTNKNLVKHTIRKQMKRVDKGCLSDPPKDLVNIFRYNPVTKCCYVARGINTNERDNLDLGTKILTASHIGIHRANQFMCSFFERKNQDKSIICLGETDNGIYDTERLLILNSYASTVGYGKDNLPFSKVTAPTISPTAPKEYMGFSYHLPEKLHKVSNLADPTDHDDYDVELEEEDKNDDESEEDIEIELTEAQKDDLVGLLGEEYDVKITTEDEYVETADSIVENELQQLKIAEEGHTADTVVNKDFIQRELARLVPNDDGRETTLQAFNRLTSDQSWIPFRMPDSTCPCTDIDQAEADYFNEMESSYSMNSKSGPKSYKNFSVAWNLEVSRRFKLWSQGEDDALQIRLKSARQLEEYYIKRHQLLSLQSTIRNATDDDNDREFLNTQLDSTRSQLPPRQDPHVVSPPVYTPQPNSITPFAHPTNLNAFIAMGRCCIGEKQWRFDECSISHATAKSSGDTTRKTSAKVVAIQDVL